MGFIIIMVSQGPGLLVALIHVLVLLGLLTLTPSLTANKKGGLRGLTLFDVDSDDPTDRTETKKEQKKAAKQIEQRAATPPSTTVPPPELPPPPLNMILMNRDDFAATDISRVRSAPAASAAASPGTASADATAGSKASTGPGGERLYRAQWYREPTDAELAYYMPHMRTSGWGEIACRTVPNFGVEDCKELDESPPGSGLARALRQAAWQFKVRPPRVGGKVLVGSWVRIHFDFTLRDAK
jgi:protein TonB